MVTNKFIILILTQYVRLLVDERIGEIVNEKYLISQKTEDKQTQDEERNLLIERIKKVEKELEDMNVKYDAMNNELKTLMDSICEKFKELEIKDMRKTDDSSRNSKSHFQVKHPPSRKSFNKKNKSHRDKYINTEGEKEILDKIGYSKQHSINITTEASISLRKLKMQGNSNSHKIRGDSKCKTKNQNESKREDKNIIKSTQKAKLKPKIIGYEIDLSHALIASPSIQKPALKSRHQSESRVRNSLIFKKPIPTPEELDFNELSSMNVPISPQVSNYQRKFKRMKEIYKNHRNVKIGNGAKINIETPTLSEDSIYEMRQEDILIRDNETPHKYQFKYAVRKCICNNEGKKVENIELENSSQICGPYCRFLTPEQQRNLILLIKSKPTGSIKSRYSYLIPASWWCNWCDYVNIESKPYKELIKLGIPPSNSQINLNLDCNFNEKDSRCILKLEGDDNSSAIEKYYSIYTIKAPFLNPRIFRKDH